MLTVCAPRDCLFRGRPWDLEAPEGSLGRGRRHCHHVLCCLETWYLLVNQRNKWQFNGKDWKGNIQALRRCWKYTISIFVSEVEMLVIHVYNFFYMLTCWPFSLYDDMLTICSAWWHVENLVCVLSCWQCSMFCWHVDNLVCWYVDSFVCMPIILSAHKLNCQHVNIPT